MFLHETELHCFIEARLLVCLLAFESPDDGLANSPRNQRRKSVANLPVTNGLFAREGPCIRKALNPGGHPHCDPGTTVFRKVGCRGVISQAHTVNPK